jgi:hypothetical protein
MKTDSIGKKKNSPVKQPFMFLYRCFLLLCWLELASSVARNFCRVGHFGAYWGLLGSKPVRRWGLPGPIEVF